MVEWLRATRSRGLVAGIVPALLLAAAACTAGVERVPVSAFPESWPYPAAADAVVATGGVVVTTDDHASRTGLDVLQRGGNAVDAAIATAFALAVVNPEAGNIGGGGFVVVKMADGEVSALDFRERAPFAAARDMFLDEAGELTDRSVVGHLATGVPGSVRGQRSTRRGGTALGF